MNIEVNLGDIFSKVVHTGSELEFIMRGLNRVSLELPICLIQLLLF